MATQPLLDLLEQIKSGICIFEPYRRTPQEISDFQDTVYRLQEIKRLGLIRNLFMEKRANADGEYCSLAMVQGGLTPEGERLIEENSEGKA